MSNLKIKILSFVSIILLFNSFVFASEDPFFLRGIRALGMGGAHVAMSDDQNAFFYNPAGVTERKRAMFTVFELRASVNKDTLDFYNWITKKDENGKTVQDKLENYDNLSEAEKQKLTDEIVREISRLNSHVVISVPNMSYISGPIGDNTFIGLGVFDKLDVRFNLDAGFAVPELNINGQADVAGMLLLAHKFTDEFSLGVNTKYLARASIKEERLNVLAIDDFDPLIQPGFGLGADIGACYKILDNFKLGMQISDVGGTKLKYDRVEKDPKTAGDTKKIKEARNDIIYQRVNVGVAYKPLQKFFEHPWVPDTTFALDFRDITNAEGNGSFKEMSEVLKRTHMGAELAWKFINGRIGLNSGYPTFGVGFYLWALKFDYAFYIDELGDYPGQIPEKNHVVTITWRFGTTLKRDEK